MGDTIEFKLDKEQTARWREWKALHAKVHPNGVRDMSGAAFKFVFLPTGMGDNVHVECIWCPGVKCVLTTGDDGEFLYNLDGTPNGWTP